MPAIFHLPIIHTRVLNSALRQACDALLVAARDDHHAGLMRRPICIGIDYYMSTPQGDTTLPHAIATTAMLMIENLDGRCATAPAHAKATRAALLELLMCLNMYPEELVADYPVLGADTDFLSRMDGRYMRLVYFGDGIGGLIQEYIPSFASDICADYCGGAASAKKRMEIFSVFLEDTGSNHEMVEISHRVSQLGDDFQRLFEAQTDDSPDVRIVLPDHCGTSCDLGK